MQQGEQSHSKGVYTGVALSLSTEITVTLVFLWLGMTPLALEEGETDERERPLRVSGRGEALGSAHLTRGSQDATDTEGGTAWPEKTGGGGGERAAKSSH